mmetsp:Transcript_41586/g.88635  ORF Transcript_41586/g.88635 Transcript_41586/m.88635 type:complete len:153 (-) Transcript_41586:85-543(-)
MAPRQGGTKRPASVNDAFRVGEDEDRSLPKDAKMSRNMGAKTGEQSGARNSPSGMYWQQTLPSSVKSAEAARSDGISAIAGTPSEVVTSSPLAAMTADSTEAAAGTNGKGMGGPLFFCWICKRKFDSNDAFDHHVFYSKLHQESIRRLAGIA